MASIVNVTIDGLPVPCGGIFGGPSWSFTAGVTPPEIVWKLDPAAADQVLSKKEVQIVFDYEGKPPLKITAVVVKEVPTGSPYSRGVLLTDRRFYWTRMWIKRTFNLRMRTGTKRLVTGPDGIPTQALALVDDLAYAKFSLENEKTAWDADGMVKEILNALGSSFKITTRSRPAIKPNDVEVDDRADQALARVLGVIGGGVDIRPEADGSFTLYDRVLGSEKAMIEKAFTAALMGLGYLRWITNANVLPIGITNLFTRDMELRLDFVEDSASATVAASDDVPSLDNVAQITDLTLKVNGSTEVQGTWVNLLDLLTAFNSSNVPFPKQIAGFFLPPQKIDTGVIQQRYLGPALYLQFVQQFGALPSRQWAGRIGSIMKSYRLDFRINRRFLSRIYPGSIRAVRVGLADAATGMRHQSPVYFDYCERPTLRKLAYSTEDTLGWNMHMLPPTNSAQNLSNNLKNYPTTINLADCTPAPANLVVTDAQSGVVSVVLRKDDFDQAEELVPCLVSSLPVVNPFKVATASALATWDQCRLAANHRMITIVSVIPAGPNNEQQLQGYSVSMQQALERLGVPSGGISAKGTVITQRIYPALERARYAWADSQRATILSAFINQGKFPSSLEPVNKDVLQEIALTFSAALYATMLPHYEGSMSKEFDPTLYPIGSVHTVTHGVDGTGRTLTTVNCEPRGPVVRPEALMSSSTRRVIFGEGVSK